MKGFLTCLLLKKYEFNIIFSYEVISKNVKKTLTDLSTCYLSFNPLEGKKNPVWATSRLLPGTDANSPDGIYMVSLRSGPSTDPKVNYTKVNHIF